MCVCVSVQAAVHGSNRRATCCRFPLFLPHSASLCINKGEGEGLAGAVAPLGTHTCVNVLIAPCMHMHVWMCVCLCTQVCPTDITPLGAVFGGSTGSVVTVSNASAPTQAVDTQLSDMDQCQPVFTAPPVLQPRCVWIRTHARYTS